MSAIIQHDPNTAYEPWRPDHFERRAPADSGPTTRQVESIRQQAQQDGFRAGVQEGRNRVNAEAMRLAAIAVGFKREMAGMEEALATQVLDLALDVAQQMLHTALRVQPDLVLPVIGQALREFSLAGDGRRIVLHPLDGQLLREHLADALAAEWQVIDDPSIARGGFRLLTSQGEVDASVSSRWRLIVASLGREDAWLEAKPA
ncbi:MAG: FliH/SctL family protein [Burkholderiales bacterium]